MYVDWNRCCELVSNLVTFFFFFFQAEDGIRDLTVTGVQTCALPIFISRLQGVAGFFGAGKTGVLPIAFCALRAAESACFTASLIGTTCSYPFLSFTARQRIMPASKSTSSQNRLRQADSRRPVPSATIKASFSSG